MSRQRRQAPQERDPRQAERIAVAAARLMAEDGIRDFAYAKRKAAEQLGVGHTRSLPTNIEIEKALVEYQRLFRAGQPAHLKRLRETAVQAMRLLARFEPRLVGPVLAGTADSHYPVTLQLFTDHPDEVAHFLVERQMPFDHDTRRVRLDAERNADLPLLKFVAGDIPVELTLFPYDGLRQPPLSPTDARPMRRANLAAVETLLAQEG